MILPGLHLHSDYVKGKRPAPAAAEIAHAIVCHSHQQQLLQPDRSKQFTTYLPIVLVRELHANCDKYISIGIGTIGHMSVTHYDQEVLQQPRRYLIVCWIGRLMLGKLARLEVRPTPISFVAPRPLQHMSD